MTAEVVHRLIRQRAPEGVALRWESEEFTLRDLRVRAARIAGALVGLARRPVAVRVPPGPDRYAALLGVLSAGAHVVWFGTGAAGERGRMILDDVRPATVLTAGAPDDLVTWYAAHTGITPVDVTDLPEASTPDPDVRPDDWAYLAHTSGSTGRPKGVPQTHAALAQFSLWFASAFGLAPGVRVAQWVHPEHDPAICETFAALVSGATLCPVPEKARVHPSRMLDWLGAERVDVFQTVPSFARELARASGPRPLPLRRLVLMGEAVPPDLVAALHSTSPEIELYNLYGPTETVAATWHHIPRGGPRVVPIGRAIPGREVLLLDDADTEADEGEMVVLSRYVTPGYLGSGRDHPAFRPVAGRGPGPWYRTGDLGRRRPDGLLEFRGRRDQQVKIQGHRIELAEIEAVLGAHPSVAECAVLAVPTDDGIVTSLVAYVVSHEDDPPQKQWRAHVRQRFGDVLLPLRFRIVPYALPRTATGKVDGRRLRGV
ncbi:amino acid adenylation domain-containing protein [Micromonospora peucetia]|uniref:Amino acid adenylation domain-containing protein n=1 Tax=Micromonospora peucetia TaxID=47871 RepID=A0A1C6VVT1_9ACTN|nr:amino acid adenylation domain-containing protein [Micromonospora peucetia]MCX4388057.1 amino acid adenylation domain-containing protein [Micromonospora peucetia]SCL70214.1 amino acid adenylation domain-containing protein [Micromonospora peucetia]